MKTLFTLSLLTLTLNSLAYGSEKLSQDEAGKLALIVEGESALAIMQKMPESKQFVSVSNSVCRTVYRVGNTTCTLMGSHASCPIQPPHASCEIEFGF